MMRVAPGIAYGVVTVAQSPGRCGGHASVESIGALHDEDRIIEAWNEGEKRRRMGVGTTTTRVSQHSDQEQRRRFGEGLIWLGKKMQDERGTIGEKNY